MRSRAVGIFETGMRRYVALLRVPVSVFIIRVGTGRPPYGRGYRCKSSRCHRRVCEVIGVDARDATAALRRDTLRIRVSHDLADDVSCKVC